MSLPRILVVDDLPSVLADYRKVLAPAMEGSARRLQVASAALYGTPEDPPACCFEVVCASHGDEAIVRQRDAIANGEPFAVAFVDMRMPPGPDGVQTIQELFRLDDDLQAVICTAYSEHSEEDVRRTFGESDRLLVLKKPFDPLEVRFIAAALARKHELQRSARAHRHQLEVALEQAQAAARAKAEFLANMSHELRTPLNAVLGLIDMTLHSDLAGDRRTDLALAKQSATALLARIDDILDLAHLERGDLALLAEPFDPRALVQSVADMLAPQASEQGLSFEVALPVVDASLIGDARRIHQVLSNITANAIKFTLSGSVALHASVERLGERRAQLTVTVTDTGIGIAPELLTQILERFSQADGSARRRYGGIGIGLCLSQHFVKVMGGALHLESQEGRGTTVRLELPLAVAAPALPAAETARAARPEADVAGLEVLVVEDNAINLRVARSMLERLGTRVTSAKDGQEALEVVARQRFDLIFMDCQMPVMDGYEATRRIRALAAPASGTPIVALTAHALRGDRERCLEAGMDDYVTKPAPVAALRDALDRWCLPRVGGSGGVPLVTR